MTIEKTFKLTIKDTAYLLTEEEVSALYTECGKALKISATNPNWPTYPPGVRKFDPVVPTYPNWPTYPPGVRKFDPVVPTYPNWPTYPYPTHCGDMPFGTTTDNSVMDWHDYHGGTGTGTGTSIKSANVTSSKGINFLSDDMETIKDNNNWRSSVQQALDKLSAKTNVTTSDGTTIR
jgi:hypothetical protein